ncbi:choice-of-anchor L domain-containing protein [Enhygromyxa salina]|nr:choice-of-anchor L domain-containing protein [Enhygromyxa salina]
MPNPAFDERETMGDATEVVGDGEDEPGDGDSNDGDGDGDGNGDGDGDGDSGDGDGDGDPGDGDGDGDPGDGDGDGPLCGAPEHYADCDFNDQDDLTDSPFAALGLGCTGPDSETIPVVEPALTANNPASWRVATHFGEAEGPHFGGYLWAAHDNEFVSPGGDLPDIPPNTSGAILILSTGLLPEPDESGGVVLQPGSQTNSDNNANASGGEFPEPISPQLGSNFGQGGNPFYDCDGVNDCSDSLYEQWFVDGWNQLHNKMWLKFKVTPPAEVYGYMFDFAFFTSEYPDFVNTTYNDMFVAWSNSEAYTGNLTFIGQSPMNTTSLAQADGFSHTDEDPALAGTGFEGYGSTNWLRARGPVAPGEEVEITLFMSDLGDKNNGSVVLLDNFRWDCGGCEVDDCGFTP